MYMMTTLWRIFFTIPTSILLLLSSLELRTIEEEEVHSSKCSTFVSLIPIEGSTNETWTSFSREENYRKDRARNGPWKV